MFLWVWKVVLGLSFRLPDIWVISYTTMNNFRINIPIFSSPVNRQGAIVVMKRRRLCCKQFLPSPSPTFTPYSFGTWTTHFVGGPLCYVWMFSLLLVVWVFSCIITPPSPPLGGVAWRRGWRFSIHPERHSWVSFAHQRLLKSLVFFLLRC